MVPGFSSPQKNSPAKMPRRPPTGQGLARHRPGREAKRHFSGAKRKEIMQVSSPMYRKEEKI
jgi:hypothetical protein